MTAVYCSGLFSGPNPSPGLGIARSLREAFPDLHLIGVDYSTRSTGLHHRVFDEVWIQRSWRELDLDAYTEEIERRLGRDALWISGLDLETRWLADRVDAQDRLLSPPAAALKAIDKPATALARRLSLLTPPTISTRHDDWELHAFGRQHGWDLWLKGPHYEAARVRSWRGLQLARARLTETWATDELHLQAHVPGTEESIVFAAYRGVVVGLSHMRKGIVTDEGKTWGGSFSDVADTVPEVGLALENVLADLGWTGGGEIEMLRSFDGELWLLECNPRFPAWQHGGTLAGLNLPGALVSAALDREPLPARARSAQFVRVVVEIPLRGSFPLPEPVMKADGASGAGKHPSGMPDLARRMNRPGGHDEHREAPVAPRGSLRDAVADVRPAERTPHRHTRSPSWKEIAARAEAAGNGRCAVKIAYSIKTDPQPDLLAAARRCGFLAEAISSDELRRACEFGFGADQVVLNGPAKSWPELVAPSRAFATFADSNSEMSSLVKFARAGSLSSTYIGPRLRPDSVASRFGVQLGDFEAFASIVRLVSDLPQAQKLGLHFHWASSEAGHSAWFEAVEAALDWGRAIQDLTGRKVRCLDLGGGWFPDDFEDVLLPRLPSLVDQCLDELDELEVLVLEPGKALTQRLAFIEATVLEVRRQGDPREIVVDASVAELPEAAAFPHRILSGDGQGWKRWGRGPDRILGRLCMENDVLRSGVAIPDDLSSGDRILIADAGAYDRSLSYDFGRG
jgi:diaminopimelate decarboxylase